MIYDLHHSYLFIHIPRTAGVPITRALAGVSSHCVVNLTAGRHMTAAALKQRLGDRSHPFRPWSIARAPRYNRIRGGYRAGSGDWIFTGLFPFPQAPVSGKHP